jgi:transcription elongation factor Elf1
MGRRRRRIIRVTKKKLPRVFSCPQCGMVSVRVLINPGKDSKIMCGSCGLSWEKLNITKMTEAIDIYNEFVDNFTSERS